MKIIIESFLKPKDNVILDSLVSGGTIQPTITPLKQKEYIKDKISDILKGNMATFLGNLIFNSFLVSFLF